MGLTYDELGRAHVEVEAVTAAAQEVQSERAARDPEWRIKNLGKHARKRPAGGAATRSEEKRKPRERGKSTNSRG
jgi:hypothetical protein